MTNLMQPALMMISILCLACVTSAHAQKFNVGVTTGLTGINLELSKPINTYITLRADTHIAGSLSNTITSEDNTYNVTFTPKISSILIDVHPFSGAFYLTGGLVKQDIIIKHTGGAVGGVYTFDNTSYEVNLFDSYTGTIGFSNAIAPYLGLGWSNRNKKAAGIAFSFETGVIDAGTGQVGLNVACGSSVSTALCSEIQTNVTAEAAKVNKDFKSDLYYPVVKLGISYRF